MLYVEWEWGNYKSSQLFHTCIVQKSIYVIDNSDNQVGLKTPLGISTTFTKAFTRMAHSIDYVYTYQQHQAQKANPAAEQGSGATRGVG